MQQDDDAVGDASATGDGQGQEQDMGAVQGDGALKHIMLYTVEISNTCVQW